MPVRLYKAWNVGEPPRWFGIRLEYDEDRWTSTCRPTDAEGKETGRPEANVPRFYGVTADQALRRTVEALENTYDEVAPAAERSPS